MNCTVQDLSEHIVEVNRWLSSNNFNLEYSLENDEQHYLYLDYTLENDKQSLGFGHPKTLMNKLNAHFVTFQLSK